MGLNVAEQVISEINRLVIKSSSDFLTSLATGWRRPIHKCMRMFFLRGNIFLSHQANLDVMVWIHGGFFQFGSGHQPGLSPTSELSSEMNAVFVSINYRLFILGFLDLTEHPDQNIQSLSGNHGISDQRMALMWIQKFIRTFGGNPERVTLFGADAGAASIIAHLTNPQNEKLFAKAWLIGPCLYQERPLSLIEHNAVFFVNRTNCTTVQCLQSLPPNQISLSYLGENDPSFRIIDQNDLPIIGIYPEQYIRIDGKLLVHALRA